MHDKLNSGMHETQSDTPPPVEVPLEALSPEALQGIIDEFISREGTDYGAVELSHEAKIRRIRNQLENEDLKIIYDPQTESVTIVTLRDWDRVKND
jgi:uncharacterized protein